MIKPIRRVTRADVAKRAGVTPTIVSYVVNNNRYVDSTKRENVKKAMKELGYRPNSMARALKGKHSHLILFIVDDLLSEHFGKINKQMNAWANENDYFICLCESRNDDDFINQIFQSYFDGVIIGSYTLKHEYIQKIIDTNIPVVLLEMRKYSDLTGEFAMINSGLYDGARICCKALLEKNREHIVYIDSFTDDLEKDHTSDDFRFEGFVEELKDNGKYKSENSRLISHCRDEDELEIKLKALIEEGFKIDAIFGRTDSVALKAMFKMKSFGYEIPKDCSIIGVNNLNIANYSDPKLTSLDIDRESIGKYATSILSKMFSGKELTSEENHIVLKTNLIDRESL
jgi:LacI family transcriptional regulator